MSLRPKRTVHAALSAIVPSVVAALVIAIPSPAIAQPEPPPAAPGEGAPGPHDLPETASEAVQQLSELSHQAEVLTEEWHNARDQLAARNQELDTARADLAAATTAVDQARLRIGEFQGQVDALAEASFQGARFNRLSALLVSDSPQEFLDQMSALDVLAADNNEAMRQLSAALEQAQQAEHAASEAEARASQAQQEAAAVEQQAAAARDAMNQQIGQVEERLAELTASERESFQTGGSTEYTASVPGSGVAAEALRLALTQQGKPYGWGAEGPDAYDCSGLVYWAYQQVGVSLPRGSIAQLQQGTAVTRDQLQPGDLIGLYSPATHIGFYVGNGQYLHAPQSGDVVKVADVPWGSVTAMRRM